MNYAEHIAAELKIRPGQAAASIELFEAGNTLPFIARYRKEATGSLDEEQLRQLFVLLEKLKTLDERRSAVLASIEEQGKLTSDLRQQILSAQTMTALEDLYQPFKPKRRTRASIARENGLQGLADLIIQQPRNSQKPERLAVPYLSEKVGTPEEALAGARDIVAEMISDHPEVRRVTREKALQWGVLRVEKNPDAEDPKGIYEAYYAFEVKVSWVKPHQILAINRGENENVLRVKLLVLERDWQAAIHTTFKPDLLSSLANQMSLAINDAAERLLLPAIERDVRRSLMETAEGQAIRVFGENLRALLLVAPLAGRCVLGIDPGFRTGCKVAIVDETGKLLETTTIYPHEPVNKRDAALSELEKLVKKYKVSLITIGNGTASRETEQLAADLIHKIGPTLQYLIVNEAGASVYSASPLARQEMPDLDVSLRGAVSIARRAQDPLAELVKIDPQSIGVGMYQHDVNQKELKNTLDAVVESVVNQVGVEVNTASPALLAHVAGIGSKLAEKIVTHRNEKGPFKNRTELRAVPGLGPKAFEQSAGFLRIREGRNPLDASAIHPESYHIAEAILDLAGLGHAEIPAERQVKLQAFTNHARMEKLAEELGCGIHTLKDIFDQLVRPGRDPREDTPPPILRTDVLKMEDLVNGMRLKGTVRNVVDFGAFVDIGVKQDGLLHRSQIPQSVRLQVGDVISVEIVKVEIERGRISLGWIE